jgi:hypothetical protein
MFIHHKRGHIVQIQLVAGMSHRQGQIHRFLSGHATQIYRHQQSGRLIIGNCFPSHSLHKPFDLRRCQRQTIALFLD